MISPNLNKFFERQLAGEFSLNGSRIFFINRSKHTVKLNNKWKENFERRIEERWIEIDKKSKTT